MSFVRLGYFYAQVVSVSTRALLQMRVLQFSTYEMVSQFPKKREKKHVLLTTSKALLWFTSFRYPQAPRCIAEGRDGISRSIPCVAACNTFKLDWSQRYQGTKRISQNILIRHLRLSGSTSR